MSVPAGLLAGAGVLVCVVSACGALVPADIVDRLHFLTPVTSLGTPLIGLGLAVHTGWHLATATILLIVAATAATGPVLAAATARIAAEQRGLIPAAAAVGAAPDVPAAADASAAPESPAEPE